jgi:hypothetical protein
VNVRTTAALAAVAALLGLYVWLVEIRGGETQTEAGAASKKILNVEADAIAVVEVPLEGEGTARVVRDESDRDQWRLESPLSYPADSGTVSGVLSALVQLEADAVIDDPGDLEAFGLGDGAAEVRIGLGEGETRGLFIGNEVPVGSARYVAVEDDDRLFTVAEWRTSALRPPLRNLRDKRVVTAGDPESFTAVRISEYDGLVAELRREAAGEEAAAWEIVAPIRERADAKRVQQLLEDLYFLRANEFVDEPEDLASYGIDRPEIKIELESGEGREVLELGRGAGKVYLRSDRTPVIFQVYDRTLADVPRDLFSYREKEVLTVNEEAISKADLRFRDGTTYTYVREEDTWQPESEQTPEVDSLRVGDLIHAARRVEATGLEEGSVVLSEVGLEPAGLRVTLRDEDGTELGWLELGDLSPDRGIVARSSQNERIWWLNEELGEDVPLSLDAFRNRFLEEGSPADLPTDPNGDAP